MRVEVPKLLYHGSHSDFGEFDTRFKGSNTEAANTVHGFFFADKAENALLFGPKIYAASVSISKILDLRLHGILSTLSQAPVLCEVLFHRSLNPKAALSLLDRQIDFAEIPELYEMLYTEKANKAFRAAGYDGIISDLGGMENEYVAFDTRQIKIMGLQNYGEERHLTEAYSRRRDLR